MEKKNKLTSIFQKSAVKNVLLALAIAVFGFLLWNLTFGLYALFQRFIDIIARSFISSETAAPNWYFALRHLLFLALILLITWIVFRTKLQPIYKAIFMTVPLAVLYLTIWIFLYQWPLLVYAVCGLLTLGLLYYFVKRKKSWFYSYTVIFVAVTLLIVMITGVEI